jgi:hypothetical protein
MAARTTAADALTNPTDQFLALDHIASDFDGLADVKAITARAAALGKEKAVRDAIKRGRDEDDRELALLETIRGLEARLASDDDHMRVLGELRTRWKDLHDRASKPEDSFDRRFARRVLSNLGATITTTDQDYLKIINENRWNAVRR